MSLPLKNEPAPSGVNEWQGPKIVSMRPYDPEVEVQQSAAAETEFVLQQAAEDLMGRSHPLHEFGERIARTYDAGLQEAAGTVRVGVDVARDLKEKDPLKFIAVVASVAFAAGFILRIWRSSRV